MAKFSVSLFEIGDHVQINDGEFKGLHGTVTDWGRISSADPDVAMIVALSEPHDHVAQTETRLPDGSTNVRKETVVISRVDVKASQLSAA